jgi:hypothetical protein
MGAPQLGATVPRRERTRHAKDIPRCATGAGNLWTAMARSSDMRPGPIPQRIRGVLRTIEPLLAGGPVGFQQPNPGELWREGGWFNHAVFRLRPSEGSRSTCHAQGIRTIALTGTQPRERLGQTGQLRSIEISLCCRLHLRLAYSSIGLILDHHPFRELICRLQCAGASRRLVAHRSCVFLYRGVRDARFPADSVPTVAGIECLAQLLLFAIAEARPSKARTVRSRAFETGFRPLTNLLALQLGERREHGEEDVADELVFSGQMLFGLRPECDAMRGEALQVRHRGRHSFAAEPIERPYEQEVELASRGAGKHRGELLSVFDAFATILVLDVFAHNWVAHARTPIAQLAELVLRVLPFVVGRHSGVDRNSCSHKTDPLQLMRVSSTEPAITRHSMR